MQALRNAKRLVSLTLAWFVCALGVAVASPLMQTQGFALVCSDTGMVRLQAISDDGGTQRVEHTLDCPLCLQPLAPPAQILLQSPHKFPPVAFASGNATSVTRSARAAPFFARGPPTFAVL